MTGKTSLEISREWIAHALREFGHELPEDAELVGIEYNAARDVYECVFVSEELPDTPEGSRVYSLREVTNE